MRDLKYLFAYLLPISAVLALSWQGAWSWATVILTFGILPAAELFTSQSTENVPEGEEGARSKLVFFDLLLYLNLPILFMCVGWYLWLVSGQSLSTSDYIGLTLSTGIIVGAMGINIAHELGHRNSGFAQFVSKLMLLPALYQHFFIEHNRGHHKNVATDKDPATARQGEVLYFFWLRSIWGGWMSAWALERERLQKEGKSGAFWANEMLRFCLAQTLWLAAISYFFGRQGLIGAVLIALVGILLLETINYIEHYGLRRKMLPSGRPEPVLPEHSWNSEHALGRIFLFELTRHSDHHFKATRKYQILRHVEPSPQLPFGYPTSVLLAFVPPLWFGIMDKRVERFGSESLTSETV